VLAQVEVSELPAAGPAGDAIGDHRSSEILGAQAFTGKLKLRLSAEVINQFFAGNLLSEPGSDNLLECLLRTVGAQFIIPS
jgi:hypothetical protein